MWDMCVVAQGSRLRLSGCGASARGWSYEPAQQRLKLHDRCVRGTAAAMELVACDDTDSHQRFVFTGEMNA